MPPFGARRFSIISSLTACDPEISTLIEESEEDESGMSVICVAAETRVFKKLSEETKGKFSVSLKSHLTRLIMECSLDGVVVGNRNRRWWRWDFRGEPSLV